MNKIGPLTCAILALFLALVAVPAQASTTAAPSLDVMLTSQNPYPVEPGGNVNIEVQVWNNGLGNSHNTMVEIITKEPFSLLPGEQETKSFANIPAGNYVTTTYNLHVDPQALTNDYEVEFRLYQKGSEGYKVGDISVSVEGEPEVILGEITTDMEKVEPGSKVELNVPIKNIGTGTARKLQVELSSNYTEILPLYSEGLVYLGDVVPGQSKMAVLKIGVDSSAEHKTYTLSLRASYKDESNDAASESFSIGLPVEGTIVMELIKTEPKYDRNVIRIEIANKGTADATSLEARLVVENKTLGVDYVSQLKATKKTTFDFPLQLEGQGQLVIDYIGPGTEKNRVVKDVSFDFVPRQSGDGTTALISIILVAVIIYLVYRKFFRKKKKG